MMLINLILFPYAGRKNKTLLLALIIYYSLRDVILEVFEYIMWMTYVIIQLKLDLDVSKKYFPQNEISIYQPLSGSC